MPIIRELESITNNKLHDAILLTTLVDNNKYSFIKLYIDPYNECAVYFKGHLSHRDIQSFFFNLRENLTSNSKVEDEAILAYQDYEYNDDGTTAIYTRDGWKY